MEATKVVSVNFDYLNKLRLREFSTGYTYAIIKWYNRKMTIHKYTNGCAFVPIIIASTENLILL